MKVILIVDDEAPVRRALRRALMATGVEDLLLLEAENGLDGLALARAREPDVIVSDWNMPVLDGLELLHALRRDGRTTRFVLVTGYPTDDTRQRAADLGADAVLQKPVSVEELARAVFGDV